MTLSQETLRAMRNLGDQIAVVFENQSLLRSTASTLQEVQGLYNINRAMLSALDPLDVLRVLRDNLAQESASITHAVVERLPDSSAETITIRHIVTSTLEQAVDIPLTGMRKAVDAFGEAEQTEVIFVEDMEDPEHRTLLHDVLKAENARSYIAIVVRERSVIEDFIAIAFDQAQQFDSRTRRLYGAVADQIGIVLENQRLLRDAQGSAIQLTRQVRVLQALNRLSTGISSFQSEKELLDYTAQSLVAALNIDHVTVAVFDTSRERSVVVSEYPLHGSVGLEIDARTSSIITALRQTPDRPVIIGNVDSDPLVEPEARDVIKKIGTSAMMVMALQTAGDDYRHGWL